MSYYYAQEKFSTAISCLTGAASQKTRLCDAMLSLQTLTGNSDAIPEEIKADVDNLWQRTTSAKAEGDEGTLEATIDKMTKEEISRCVEKIIGMYEWITRHEGPLDE